MSPERLASLVLAGWGLSSLVTVLPPGRPLRRLTHGWPLLGELLRCPACLGFWVGLVLSLGWLGLHPVAVLHGLLVSGGCWLLHATLGQAPWSRGGDPAATFSQAIDFATAARDPAQLAELCHQAALLHMGRREAHRAEPLFARALALWQREGMRPEEERAAKLNLVVARWRSGDWEGAAALLQALLEEELADGERALLCASLCLVGGGPAAEEEALALARRTEDPALLLSVTRLLAEARLARGDEEAARGHLQEARQCLRALAAQGEGIEPADLVALGASLWRAGLATPATMASVLRALPAALDDPDTAWELPALREALAALPPDPEDPRVSAGVRMLCGARGSGRP